jgi:hypothetical protein
MSEQTSDDTVFSKGLTALEDKLGPVDTLRFLAVVSRQKFDYQQWRNEHFGPKSLEQVFTEAEAAAR